MPIQLLINLFIAFLWMFLQDSFSILSFFSGYLVGLFIVFLMRRFFRERFYFLTSFAILKLFNVFIKELVVSSIIVSRQVVRPKLNVTPGVFLLKTDLEKDWQVSLLGLLLSLTPGSVVLEVTENNKEFYIHAMDLPESQSAIEKSKVLFEKAIREVAR